MLPAVLYCSAVFTILILYYFYKPDDDKQHERMSNQPSITSSSKYVVDIASHRAPRIVIGEVGSRTSVTFDTSSIQGGGGDGSDSLASFDSFAATTLASAHISFLAMMFDRVRNFYYDYLFELLLPTFKYLGLNSRWERDDEQDAYAYGVVSPTSQLIEDHFRQDF